MRTYPIFGSLSTLLHEDLPTEIVSIGLQMGLDALKVNEHVVLVYSDDEAIRSMRLR